MTSIDGSQITNEIDCGQARYLLNTYRERLDRPYIEERATQEDVRDTLDALWRAAPRSR